MPPKLYRHQEQAGEKVLELHGRCGLFPDVGTGKTRVAIEAAKHLANCHRILVVAPLFAAGVWRDQVKKWAPEARTLRCIRGSIVQRAAKLRRLRIRKPSRRVYVVVGYESYWREPLRSEILKYDPQMIIYDEAHRLKGKGTKQSRFAHSLASTDGKLSKPVYILALTGTPAPNGPHDFFSLFKAFAPAIFGTRWLDFEDRYVVRGGFQRYQIVGYRNLPELEEKVAANSFRITKAEALDLPEEVDVEVPVVLSKKAREIYDRLAKDAIAEIEGFQGKGIALSRIVLTNIIRLQQVASGFVKVEDGRILDFDTAKRNALADLLQDIVQAAGRVVVFCRFRHDVDAAIEVAKKIVGDAVFRIDGTVSVVDRERQLPRFRTFEPSVLVGQIQVASLAIDLSCAHIGVFYSRDYSLLNFDQARGRLHRHGQKEKVTYYHLLAEKTIDGKIYEALKKKDELQRQLLDKGRARVFFGSR